VARNVHSPGHNCKLSYIDQTHISITGDDGQRLIVIAVKPKAAILRLPHSEEASRDDNSGAISQTSTDLSSVQTLVQRLLSIRHKGLSLHNHSSCHLGPDNPHKQTACNGVAF